MQTFKPRHTWFGFWWVFCATTSNWVVLYAPTMWWLIVCVVYVFRPMEQWWFELVVWIVWKNIIATYNQTYLHMQYLKEWCTKFLQIFLLLWNATCYWKHELHSFITPSRTCDFLGISLITCPYSINVFVELDNGVIKFGLVGNVIGTIFSFWWFSQTLSLLLN